MRAHPLRVGSHLAFDAAGQTATSGGPPPAAASGPRRPRRRDEASAPSLRADKTRPSDPPSRSNAPKRPTPSGCKANRASTSCTSAEAEYERRPGLGGDPWLTRTATSGSKHSSLRATGCVTRSASFVAAGLAFGHGATNALDEAAFLILEGLKLPIDALDPFLDARLLRHERARLCDLIEARTTTRKPAAYLLNRVYIQGVPFYVDERVIVPRSLIGELLMTTFAEDNALTGDPRRIASVLDLCAGGGSLAILAARVFPNARIEAVELSAGALDVAAPQRRGARAGRPHRAQARAICSPRSKRSATT